MLLLFLFAFALWAEPIPEKVTTCTTCHGPLGISINDQWPNLAGQKEHYLIQQLQDFRAGTRVNPLMTPVSRLLTDQDIAQLATYYSHLAKAP